MEAWSRRHLPLEELKVMLDLICPYSALLAKKCDFACPNADEVIRRGGSEYVCLQPTKHEVCSDVHKKVKETYLETQGLDDDLLSLPHSTFVKIQFGCVLGLQSALGREVTKIEDIGSLIADTINNYKNIDDLPFEAVNERITTYKLEKRGKRNK